MFTKTIRSSKFSPEGSSVDLKKHIWTWEIFYFFKKLNKVSFIGESDSFQTYETFKIYFLKGFLIVKLIYISTDWAIYKIASAMYLVLIILNRLRDLISKEWRSKHMKCVGTYYITGNDKMSVMNYKEFVKNVILNFITCVWVLINSSPKY